MNVNHLKAFHAVMQAGSMSEAARQLRVTQPAITKSIRLLEQETGLILFRRLGDKLHPSAEAEGLFVSAKRVFEELDAAAEHARRMKRGDAGTLRIASAFTMTATFIPRAIRAFRILRPRIPLKFMAAPPKQVVRLVERHEVDVGLLYEQVAISNIQSEKLFETPIICAVPTSHGLSKRRVVSVEDAIGEEVISFPRDSYAGQLVQRALGPHDLSVTIEVNSTAVALSLVALGVGIAIVDGLALTKELEPDVCLKPFVPSCILEPSAIHAIDRPTSPLCREFISAVRSVVVNHAAQGRLTPVKD